MLGRWPVGSYKEQGRGWYTQATLGQFQKIDKGNKEEDQEGEEGIEEANSKED